MQSTSTLLYIGDYDTASGPFIRLLTIDNLGSIVAPKRVSNVASALNMENQVYRPISGLAILGTSLYAAVSDGSEQKLFVCRMQRVCAGCTHPPVAANDTLFVGCR